MQIEVYTDPLCCWSWAFEPQWRKLRYAFSGKIKWRYRMGGLIPSWDSFSDPMNSISRPLQMGPLWLEAKHRSGMPIHDRVWFENPPKSSIPACLAVKTAELQSPVAAEQYLRAVREAVMLQGRDISERKVLLEVASELARRKPAVLDFSRFEQELGREASKKALEEDLQKTRLHGITRFPTLTIHKPGAAGVMIVGYRPYEALLEALKQVAPELTPTQHAEDEEKYSAYWGEGITEREVAEALQTSVL